VNILQRYRGIPALAAIIVALMISLLGAIAGGALSAAGAGFLFVRADDPFGVTGIIPILVGLNVAVPLFVAVFAFLINRHYPTSWRSPTFAFGLCILALWLVEPFSIRFAPFMLGTGAIVWLTSCWLLRKKGRSTSPHVV
jgi:hypothetical protein